MAERQASSSVSTGMAGAASGCKNGNAERGRRDPSAAYVCLAAAAEMAQV